jgi:hypothetical protein
LRHQVLSTCSGRQETLRFAMQAWVCAIIAVCLDGFFDCLLIPYTFLIMFEIDDEDDDDDDIAGKGILLMFAVTFLLHTAASAMVIVKTIRLKKLLHPVQSGMAVAV